MGLWLTEERSREPIPKAAGAGTRAPSAARSGGERAKRVSPPEREVPSVLELGGTKRQYSTDAEIPGLGLALAQEAYPTDVFPVDLTRAIAGEPIPVESECPGIPSYFVVPLFIDRCLAGIVLLDKVADRTVDLAAVHPVGPAYTGEDALAPHGQVRETTFPPFGADHALSEAGVGSGAEVHAVYTCPAGVAVPQVDFQYRVASPGGDVVVGALDGILEVE